MIILRLAITLYITLTSLSSFTASSGLGCSHQPRDPYSPALQVDLKKNKVYGSDANIVWVNYLKAKRGVCANQGKLRIRFDPRGKITRCPKWTARIDLWFARIVRGFSFDIADSPTVNGWGGDAGTTTKGAEVHGHGKNFYIFTNDFPGHQRYTINGHLTVESKPNVIGDHMTIYISHERVEVTNYRGYQAVYDSRYLFQLSGRRIASPPSTATDIWLSMNRVIQGTYRSGTGLCWVAISWV